MVELPILRMGLYGLLTFFTFIVFCLSCARLNYTNHLAPNDPLNHGRSFYDPIVAEILVTTLFTIPWCICIIFSIHKRIEHPYLATFGTEIVGLSVLWVFWIIGAAIASNLWGSLSWCQHIEACRVLSAMVAFLWLSWLTLSAILGISLLFSFANKAFKEPLHGRWDPRISRVTEMRQV
ncbi:hypothetical protein CPB83DRAFT_495100 [Crepidotus variabilis]|uniref:MARVEL domain-containing protein n=1 Tax=Crepidotus variabilis TaxID=179855 RepID=A0A9P6EC46_9AGAR|nr:hypothetical protein CPB83DRAFT_495100 [Crepidotus variabilis]